MTGPLEESQEHDRRLSRIATRWSMIAQAHADSRDKAGPAQAVLLERYRGPVYRYLLGAVQDPEIAEELSHEFAVRFLRGDFHRASPDRGKFRNYVKTVLINLVNDHHRSLRENPRQIAFEEQFVDNTLQLDDTVQSLEDHLREELLESTWKILGIVQPSYHSVLRIRVDEPEKSSRQIAEQINHQQNKSISSDSVRKTLERARTKFADLLLEQVEIFSGAETSEQLEAELQQLNLLKYCRSALDKRIENG